MLPNISNSPPLSLIGLPDNQYTRTVEIAKQPTFLATSRPHFQLLDGLRGVAAIAVLIFHFMEFAVPDYTKSFIAHGYLAVDFFFCLSGFVIGYAYDSKMTQLSVRDFLTLRLIRLQPLIIIGSILGLISFLVDPYRNFYQLLGFGKTLWMTIASCLMLPYPVLPQRYNNLFHLNPPTWSLLWEYIASLVYALVLVKITNKALWLITIVSALGLIYTVIHFKSLGVGWGAENALGGAARVSFSFSMGLLVFRSGWLIPSRLGTVSCSLILAAIFMVPFRDGLNQVSEPLLVILGFPLLITVAAGSRLSAREQSVCKALGDLSYPLYMIHYPFLWILLSYMEVRKPSFDQLKLIMPLMGIGLIGLAYLVVHYVDKPLRNYLNRRYVNRAD
ncbi:acyltransferase [Fibrella aestuarina]|uniref:Acyltransferase n=1 Tax=Fibrivirga algicola TaxID=2950420 RepID=A0ABX0QL75_9BACT|nr:acyltransferase [Fibrivirga algicola]